MARKSETKIVGAPDPFVVEKGVLRANADMYWEYLEDFDLACKSLLATRKAKLEVDLTEVTFISSSFLGCLNNLVMQAAMYKKQIVLKVSQDTSWLFDIMGSRKNMDMQVY